MKIEKVIYELYESDYLCIKGNENSNVHEIDREVRIELEDGMHVYVSWSNEPVQYSVGYKEERWNINVPEITIDVSSWKMWGGLIGQSCKFIYNDKAHQILELKCSEHSIFFSSQEDGCWEMDVLHISSSKPTVSS